MASSSGSMKVCFNSSCKDPLQLPRQGWRCRTGDFADLCDRCASAYHEEKFCETYHSSASGWRCCESCGKKIHCGCIVSFHMFVLLDAGGIECIDCAKTDYILTPNPAWPSASRFFPAHAERNVFARNWSSIAGSGPVPWRQAPNLFNSSKVQPELQSRTPIEVDIPSSINGVLARHPLSASPQGKRTSSDLSDRPETGNLQIVAAEIVGDRPDGIQHQSSIFTDEIPTPLASLPPIYMEKDQRSNQEKVSEMHVQERGPPPSVGKQVSNDNGIESSLEAHTSNGNPRGETRGQNQLLPRYSPRLTNEELQQISGDPNAKITPLFEKVLTASDAGRIGRLVLPKKCAEAYLPPISEPEGLPLMLQDLTGKDWKLQFRYWPNNNSRMYVLEGITPCIQSMQLQAGDTVTFSRLEPEGKLVLGFRKASMASPSDQGRSTDPARGRLEINKSAYIAKKVVGAKVSIHAKRKKGGKMGKNKRHKFDNTERIQVTVTFEQAQDLLRPPSDCVPAILLIDGIQFEGYKDGPHIGKPTPIAPNLAGLSSSAQEEVTPEQVSSKKKKAVIIDLDPLDPDEGPDALASPQATTKHPRHRPGCTCIVCMQPPSGTKHKPGCMCNACMTLLRRFQTLTSRRGQRQSEKEAGNARQKSTQTPDDDVIVLPETENGDSNKKLTIGEGSEGDLNAKKSTPLTFKSQIIDLNVQPDREDESPPVSESTGMTRMIQESTGIPLDRDI